MPPSVEQFWTDFSARLGAFIRGGNHALVFVRDYGGHPGDDGWIDAGMSQGAALAFLITSAGTSFGAVAGTLAIARWRVIARVIGTLWVGAIILG